MAQSMDACVVLAAAVFLTSWPGLIGLSFPLAGIAVARWRDFGIVRALTCVAGLAGAAYGLAAFWMTPAYFVSSRIYNRVVFRHTMLTAPWNRTTWIILAIALAVLAFCLLATGPVRTRAGRGLDRAIRPGGGELSGGRKLPSAFAASLPAGV